MMQSYDDVRIMSISVMSPFPFRDPPMTPLEYESSLAERRDFVHTLGLLAPSAFAVAAAGGMFVSQTAAVGIPCLAIFAIAAVAIGVALFKWRKRAYIFAVVIGWVLVGLGALMVGVFLFGLVGIITGLLKP